MHDARFLNAFNADFWHFCPYPHAYQAVVAVSPRLLRSGEIGTWQGKTVYSGEWLFCRETAEGRDVIGLLCPGPIVSDPSLEEMARASAELQVLAGVR